jgi:hypothetical protein
MAVTDTTTVTASCPKKPDLQVSLPEHGGGQVEHVSCTRLVYPGVDISWAQSVGRASSKLRLPLPITLEELFSGATEEVVLVKTERNKGQTEREETI